VAHRIEAAKTDRSSCVTCTGAITRGAARVAEERWDDAASKVVMRYHHLECAITANPELVQRARVEVGFELDLALLQVQIDASLEGHRQARREAYEALFAVPSAAAEPVAAPGDDELAAQLEADPDDTGVLAVVADQLQHTGDPRGELIAVQLALGTAHTRSPGVGRARDPARVGAGHADPPLPRQARGRVSRGGDQGIPGGRTVPQADLIGCCAF
jgi:uncharacterized protein (TIGR02996 family)